MTDSLPPDLVQAAQAAPPAHALSSPAPRSNRQSIPGRLALALALVLWAYWPLVYLIEYRTRDMPKSQLRGLEYLVFHVLLSVIALLLVGPLAAWGMATRRHRRSDAIIAAVLLIAFVTFPLVANVVIRGLRHLHFLL